MAIQVSPSQSTTAQKYVVYLCPICKTQGHIRSNGSAHDNMCFCRANKEGGWRAHWRVPVPVVLAEEQS